MNLHDPVIDLQNACMHFRSLIGQHDCELVAMFPQSWPNTGGGFCHFGGVYGQAFTSSYTTVLMNTTTGEHGIYFGGRYAYSASASSRSLRNDIMSQNLVGQRDGNKYMSDANETAPSRQ